MQAFQSVVDDQLHQAATRGSILEMAAALSYGAQLESRDGEGNTALHRASTRLGGRACAWLLEQGADASARDKLGNTPLHLAALFNSPMSCRDLWRHGAKLEAVNHAQRTPLVLSTEHRSASVLGAVGAHSAFLFLRAVGAKIDPNDRQGRIEAAVAFGDLDLLIAALEQDPDQDSLPRRIRETSGLGLGNAAVTGVLCSWLAAARSARDALADIDKEAGQVLPASDGRRPACLRATGP